LGYIATGQANLLLEDYVLAPMVTDEAEEPAIPDTQPKVETIEPTPEPVKEGATD
jgi:hypothetical protein